MAISVDKDKLPEKGTGDGAKETKVIPEGLQVARFVSYVEMGRHAAMFNGKPDVFASGKRVGQVKDPETIIQLVFEFPTAEYTGDYPLCICTSIPYGKGEFINKLSISDALLNGTLSRQYAMKSHFMKYLEAFKRSTGKDFPNMDAYVGSALLIPVTHRHGKPDEAGVVPCYACMKPEGITSPTWKHPLTGAVENLEVPPAKGKYCPVFDWDKPTLEGWKLLSPNIQAAIKGALNFDGSPTQRMILGAPEADASTKDAAKKDTTPPPSPAPVPPPTNMAPGV